MGPMLPVEMGLFPGPAVGVVKMMWVPQAAHGEEEVVEDRRVEGPRVD